jgi:hypothetical protein
MYTLWKRGLNGEHTGEKQVFQTWKQLIRAIVHKSAYYDAGYGWTIERKGYTVAGTCTLIQFNEECCTHDAPWNGKPFYPSYARFRDYLTMDYAAANEHEWLAI